MVRLAVGRSSVRGGVAHSRASKIPWKKRIGVGVIQKGGFSQSFAKLERRKKQKGGFFKALERTMFGVKGTRSKRKRQKPKNM
jgi:hypothetical protein